MHRSLAMIRFLPPLLVTLAIFAFAPAMGPLAPWLRAKLGEGFAPLVTWSLAAAGAAGVVFVLRLLHTGSHLPRPTRYALVLAGPALAILQQLASTRGTPAEAAVERAHLLFYGALMILLHRAFFLGRVRAGRVPGPEVPLAALAITTLVAFADEGLQWALVLRVGELYDVAFDVFAAGCALLTACGLYPPRWTVPLEPRPRRLLASLCAAVALCAAAFIDLAHLGYLIRDPELGSFRSYFSASELARRDLERRERWASTPPRRPFGALEIEDYYQTEAGW
ncbi:MAG TPA: VanZ family protein, partial [Thermoanaerobaculia bacterium]|nr:VanZ family protein [Thermoanaerobaculia bacterium]